MDIDVILEDPRWTMLEALAQPAARAVAAHLSVAGEVVIMGCDDDRIATLNAEFRGKPTPTNVLSWPTQARQTPEGARPARPTLPELGDIAIAFETCTAEAAAQEKPFEHHVTHLIVHGILHLLGYDHETDGDAALMEQIEVEILGNLGIADPYSVN